MERKKLESKFVRLIMKDASATDIDEATRNWFGYLQTLIAAASDAANDSRNTHRYVRFDNDSQADL